MTVICDNGTVTEYNANFATVTPSKPLKTKGKSFMATTKKVKRAPAVMNRNSRYELDDIPPSLQNIPDEPVLMKGHKEGTRIKWGWAQWSALTPKLARHIKAQGRTGLANAVDQAQKSVLPRELHRSRSGFSVACSPSAVPDIIKIVNFLAAQPGHLPPLRAQPPSKQEAAPPPAATAQSLPDTTSAPPPPFLHANGQLAQPDHLQGFLSTPIGAFVPSFKAFLTQALQELLTPHRDFIAETVRAAVIDVIGAPATPTLPPDPPPDTPETVEAKAVQAAAVADMLQQAISEPAQETQPIAAEPVPTEPPAQPEPLPEKIVQPAQVAPHDLESQLHVAAKVLGLKTETLPKHAVLVVGLHPKVEQEVERFYGKNFRFTFRRPDAVKGASDVPASTDVILLHRKVLGKELLQLTRRDAIPVHQVQNSSIAVLQALREFTGDDIGHLHASAHESHQQQARA